VSEQVKPIVGRIGGKARIAPWIAGHLNQFEWALYCEPFAGSAAVYFRLLSEGVFERIRERGLKPRAVLNDTDSRLVNVFRVCRDFPELLAYAIAVTPYSREEYQRAQVKDIPEYFSNSISLNRDIETARQHVLDSWQSFSRRPGAGWGTGRQCDISATPGHGITTSGSPEGWDKIPARILAASAHLGKRSAPPPCDDTLSCLNETGRAFVSIPDPADIRTEAARIYLVDSLQSFGRSTGAGWGFAKGQERSDGRVNQNGDPSDTWQSLPHRLLSAVRGLKPCYLENSDAFDCMKRWATPHTCFYLDPPYVGAEGYYKSGNNKNGREESFHRQLSQVAGEVEAACVAVSYYDCPLVRELYPESGWECYRKETVASAAGSTKNSKTKTHPKKNRTAADQEAPKSRFSKSRQATAALSFLIFPSGSKIEKNLQNRKRAYLKRGKRLAFLFCPKQKAGHAIPAV